MDSKKIGSFIAKRRKALGMTQLELANKLNITDRAISKWENGRGLPDISLIKPLCDQLDITVNDLLSGEKLQESQIEAKSEENIINTLQLSNKKQKSYKKIIVAAILLTFLPIIILFSFFCIDIYRMKNNQSVFFSTWGYSYVPPIDLNSEKIEIAVEKFVTDINDLDYTHYDNEKYFSASHIYLIEETKAKQEYNVYAWILCKSYYTDENGVVKEGSGFSCPYKFIVKRNDEIYSVADAITPRDGSYYPKDMKRIFPYYVRLEMDEVHETGTYERVELEITERVNEYFNIS
ncbi:MAG: helix-turn-helix transcriptional regulator [Clostridia bacterium]|nr:helix-turn-helix transcriptional regulator [Clostridia bacterium]